MFLVLFIVPLKVTKIIKNIYIDLSQVMYLSLWCSLCKQFWFLLGSVHCQITVG